jgi:hypothetical protein
MSIEYPSANPYLSPTLSGNPPAQREKAPASLMLAGMAMCAVSGLGLVYAIFSFAFSFGEAHVDPNAPEMVRRIQEGTVGPVATGIQGGFAMLNLSQFWGLLLRTRNSRRDLEPDGSAVTGCNVDILRGAGGVVAETQSHKCRRPPSMSGKAFRT